MKQNCKYQDKCCIVVEMHEHKTLLEDIKIHNRNKVKTPKATQFMKE